MAAIRGADSSNTKKQLTAAQQAALDRVKAGATTQTKPRNVFTGSDNTVHGTAGRRGKTTGDSISAATTIPSGLACPFCGVAHSNEVDLVSHVESVHTNVSSSGTGTTASTSGNERCPMCSMTFASAVDLVNHFESAHGSGNPSSTRSGGKSDCSLA